MEDFVRDVERAVQCQNYYAALALALALPDICARIAWPEVRSQARYRKWWREFALPHFTLGVGAFHTPMIFLNDADAYALRCAYLHEGRDDISEQSARQILDRIAFTMPTGTGHLNHVNNVLQLEVDKFCLSICAIVRNWLEMMEAAENIPSRIPGLIRIWDDIGELFREGMTCPKSTSEGKP